MVKHRTQPWYAFMLLLTIAFTLGALITLGADAHAAAPNLLGYKGISPLAPLTTLGLLACSMVTCMLRARFFVKKVLEN